MMEWPLRRVPSGALRFQKGYLGMPVASCPRRDRFSFRNSLVVVP